jgi:DNA-binding MarR family transcriptional regulator
VSAPEPTNREHPATILDDIVHQRTRLGILAVLAETGVADFTYLKSTLQLTDGNLGRHLEVLVGGGFITVRKGYEGKRPRTWAEITRLGRDALAAEIAAFKEIVRRVEHRKK